MSTLSWMFYMSEQQSAASRAEKYMWLALLLWLPSVRVRHVMTTNTGVALIMMALWTLVC